METYDFLLCILDTSSFSCTMKSLILTFLGFQPDMFKINGLNSKKYFSFFMSSEIQVFCLLCHLRYATSKWKPTSITRLTSLQQHCIESTTLSELQLFIPLALTYIWICVVAEALCSLTMISELTSMIFC